MSNKLESRIDYYFNPYLPIRDTKNQLKSNLELILPDDFFSDKKINEINFILNYYNYSKGNIAPEVGEILATQILDYNISLRTSKHKYSESSLIKINGKTGYTINSFQNLVAKISEGKNIVILEKTDNNNYKKFEYKVRAEIDGLYMIKGTNDKKQKKDKIFYAIETKTGTTSMDKEHIVENIISPLKNMYKSKVNYVLIGFESRIFKDKKKKIFSDSIQEINSYLSKHGVSFYPLAFPFNENQFSNFINKINIQRSGWNIVKYCQYNEQLDEIQMILPDGREIIGILQPQNPYKYK